MYIVYIIYIVLPSLVAFMDHSLLLSQRKHFRKIVTGHREEILVVWEM
jgi:hypothetical protein